MTEMQKVERFVEIIATKWLIKQWQRSDKKEKKKKSRNCITKKNMKKWKNKKQKIIQIKTMTCESKLINPKHQSERAASTCYHFQLNTSRPCPLHCPAHWEPFSVQQCFPLICFVDGFLCLDDYRANWLCFEQQPGERARSWRNNWGISLFLPVSPRLN